MSGMGRPLRTARDFCDGVRAGDRRVLAKAITLIESRRPDQVRLGHAVVESLADLSGGAVRLGISGPPGVGKSRFTEALGLMLVEKGHRIAVLAVDPSSPVSGGSILGDKTRMGRLAQCDEVFIRPSPSGGTLGGVAHRTRESLLLCEAAGFDVVCIETVGVGQSEVDVAQMTDFFCVLLQPGAGDELQGIKRGVLELADALVVTKADGASTELAMRTQAEYTAALELIRPTALGWRAPVLRTSAVTGLGISEVWDVISEHRALLEAQGDLDLRRREQARTWFWRLLDEELHARLRAEPSLAGPVATLEEEVASGRRSAPEAVRSVVDELLQSKP